MFIPVKKKQAPEVLSVFAIKQPAPTSLPSQSLIYYPGARKLCSTILSAQVPALHRAVISCNRKSMRRSADTCYTTMKPRYHIPFILMCL